MGWSVRADVNVEWTDDNKVTEKEVADTIKELMDAYELHEYGEGVEVCYGVDFSLWGNKVVDYSGLEDLKTFMKNRNVENFEITASEYAETGSGYYYDSNEDEENEISD